MTIQQTAARISDRTNLNRFDIVGDIKSLHRAAKRLHRWYEHECNGVIQRDDDTGKPYWYSSVTGKRLGVAYDVERAAHTTIARVCSELGLYYYLQTDPRGGTLYISNEPLDCQNYDRGVFVA